MWVVGLTAAMLRVFLDCGGTFCHDEYLREEVEIAEYVRDRSDADVHILVTRAQTSAGGQEYTLAFIGLRRFGSITRTLTVTTEPNESDDRVRRHLATAVTVGLLSYLSPDAVPPSLDVSARLAATAAASTPAADRWNRWIFSLDGNMNLESEESRLNRNWGASAGADRVTPDWKLSLGARFNESRARFDLDDDDGDAGGRGRVSVVRKNRSINWLGVKSLGEHWSAGLLGHVRSSTFDNIQLDLRAAPALEWNFFPYSMYTRRQLRVLYAVGASSRDYYEETLFGRSEETRAHQELSTTYEQREPWGTVEARFEASNFFPGLGTHRLEIDAEADFRITRGLSLSLEASASRIRDQLSLPRRNASAEEVLLRVRQLRSGFEARLELGIEYQFGSRFAAIVNPRFGQ